MDSKRGLWRGASMFVLGGAIVLGGALTLWAQNNRLLPIDPGPGNGGGDGFLEGWSEFADPRFLLDTALTLLCAIAMSTLIAYHPATQKKASSITELEQPKTFIMYSMVGAMIARVVAFDPTFGLVIFGIGGLLRFRTDVGQAKDTGRVILVTIIGLCCGVKFFVMAVLATVFGWILIQVVESQLACKLVVKGLDNESIPEAERVYAGLLRAAGCSILGGKKNLTKSQFSFVFRAPHKFDRDVLESEFSKLDEKLRGAIDWEIS